MIPQTRVAIEFDLIPLATTNLFTLNDPIKGALNNTEFPLGAEAFIDVTDDVRQVSVKRGRSWQLDKFQAGAADVVFRNDRRQFDPTNPPDLGQRENLSENPSFEVDLTGYGTGESFFTVGETQRFNLLPNPSFEVSLAGWSASVSSLTTAGASVSLSTLQQVQGLQSALVQISDGSSGEGIHFSLPGLGAGTTYTVTAFVRPEEGTTAELLTRDVTHGVDGSTSVTAVGGDWTRLVSTITTGGLTPFLLDDSELDDPAAPLGGDTVIQIGVRGTDVTLPGDFILNDAVDGVLGTSRLVGAPLFFVDAVMVEETAVVLPYFDGNDADSSLNDAALSWSGTPGLSPSVLTFVVPDITRSTGLARFGLSSALVEVNTRFAGQGIFTTLSGLDANTTYVVSVFVYVQQGSAVRLGTRDVTNGVNGSVSAVASVADWTRISSVITTGPPPPNFILDDLSDGLLDTSTLGEGPIVDVLFALFTTSEFLQPGAGPFSVFNVDAVLVEEGSQVLAYFDGNQADPSIALPETSWLGVNGLSRSALDFRIPGTGSPFFPEVKPRKRIRIETASVGVFFGTIEDWDYDYPRSNDSSATVRVSDSFAFFANALIDPVSVPGEGTGARVSRILDRAEINWPADLRDIDAGDATLAAQDIGGDTDPKPVNALQYLQEVEEAEQGGLFLDPSGVLRFRERTASQVLSGVEFRDDGLGVPFMEVSVDYGVESLRNRVIISRLGGSLITVEDTASIGEYGPFSLEVRDSLLADDTQAEDWALRVIAQYAEPVLRIDRITVDLRSLTSGQVSDVLGLDLGDVVEVVFTPNRVGSPISQVVQVDAISHDIQVSDHRVGFDVSQVAL